jgi:Kef-type K+ transport system membrane component KefB
MNNSELFLLAMAIIYTLPYLVWRLARTEHFAPLVVVQIITGVVLGPGMLGAWYPHYYAGVFTPAIIQSLNGVAWWAVMCFVWIAGIELDLKSAWTHRRESCTTAVLALVIPLLLGCGVAMVMSRSNGWAGANALHWQFVVGVGMSCAVTALPVLILFLEKLELLRLPFGQRILRYASLDDMERAGIDSDGLAASGQTTGLPGIAGVGGLGLAPPDAETVAS